MTRSEPTPKIMHGPPARRPVCVALVDCAPNGGSGAPSATFLMTGAGDARQRLRVCLVEPTRRE